MPWVAGSDATAGGSMPSNVGGIMLEFVINLGTTFLHTVVRWAQNHENLLKSAEASTLRVH